MPVSGPQSPEEQHQSSTQRPVTTVPVGRGLTSRRVQGEPVVDQRSAATTTGAAGDAGQESHLAYMLRQLEMDDNLVEEKGTYGER